MSRVKRILQRLIPFKGMFAHEVQIGPLVITWWHIKDYKKHRRAGAMRSIGRLAIWRDSFWRK